MRNTARAQAARDRNAPLPPKRSALRVATLNIWGRFADWPARREILATQLPPLDIDVYLLQEVVCGDGRGDQLRDLARLLSFESTARVIAESRPHEVEDEGVAILSRVPLRDVAVWPLPPSHPPRHRLEATVDCGNASVRLTTLHAAVSPDDERDRQIAALTSLRASPLLIGADLNAPPSVVRRLLGQNLIDTLEWDEDPTWPVDEEVFVRAWEEKLGETPDGIERRRLDYILVRGVRIDCSDSFVLGDDIGIVASDHKLVWADVSI